ncbi:MAG: hypothetical protein HY867_06140 [Chloroflexi bacterium]|nr:hypothetical protein [Chloroflexota bacterium]
MDWNHWTVTQTRLRDEPGGALLCEMPFGSRIYATGQTTQIIYSGQTTSWAQVIYQTSIRTYTGWCYAPFIEPLDLHDERPIVPIPHQTENPQDAAQYMIWLNQIQYNLCGELCVCYIAEAPLDHMLTEWQAKAPTVWNSVFYGGRARTTGLPDLTSMLTIYGYPAPVRLDAGLLDPILGRPLVTPARMERMLVTHQAIVGVKIETTFGRLKPSGVGHWVVLENVYPHGVNGGVVQIYNPFTNHMEGYSWAEFTASMGAPLGLWVARKP